MDLLIVDDDKELRETLKEVFEKDGYLIDTASCGEEAIYIVRRRPVRVLISDYDMPDFNGIELIRKLKEELHRVDIRYLLMTGEIDIDFYDEALRLGIEHLFRKPFELLVLKRYLESILSGGINYGKDYWN
ncbi:MAG: response regulator [Candidatus Hydrogenedentota bacterium]